jgi:hypothetical protein
LGGGLKVGFEVICGKVMADFQARFTQVTEAAAVKQLCFEPTLKNSAWALSYQLPQQLLLCPAS